MQRLTNTSPGPHLVIGISVPSGVDAQPKSGEETLRGARNRAETAADLARLRALRKRQHQQQTATCTTTRTTTTTGHEAVAESKQTGDDSADEETFAVGIEGGIEQGVYALSSLLCYSLRQGANESSPLPLPSFRLHSAACRIVCRLPLAACAVGGLWFESGYIAVQRVADRKTGFGTSARFQLADKVVRRLFAGEELATVVDEYAAQRDVRSSAGMMGMVTNGALPRDACYVHGIIFALAPFVSDPIWWDAAAAADGTASQQQQQQQQKQEEKIGELIAPLFAPDGRVAGSGHE